MAISEKQTELQATVGWIDYHPGGTNCKGEKIRIILSSTEKACVYKIAGEEDITWETNPSTCSNRTEANAYYYATNDLAKAQLSNRKHKIARQLAIGGLIKALNADKSISIQNFFLEAEDFILTTLNENAHLRFIMSALLTTLLSFIPVLFYYFNYGRDDIYRVLLGCVFGAFGSFVSILQRFQTIPIPKYSTWRYTAIRGVSRILLGSIFGGLFIIAQKSGVVLNVTSSTVFLNYCFAFISGLSERFFPELLTSLNTKLETPERVK